MKCLDCEREAVDGGLYCSIHPDLRGTSYLHSDFVERPGSIDDDLESSGWDEDKGSQVE